jgi:hypothetical protein
VTQRGSISNAGSDDVTIAAQQIDRDILPRKAIELDVTVPASGTLVFSGTIQGPSA